MITHAEPLEIKEQKTTSRIYQCLPNSQSGLDQSPGYLGKTTGMIDLSGLVAPEGFMGQLDVFNGIAYDPAGDRLFVTGKLWPKLFEVKLKRK